MARPEQLIQYLGKVPACLGIPARVAAVRTMFRRDYLKPSSPAINFEHEWTLEDPLYNALNCLTEGALVIGQDARGRDRFVHLNTSFHDLPRDDRNAILQAIGKPVILVRGTDLTIIEAVRTGLPGEQTIVVPVPPTNTQYKVTASRTERTNEVLVRAFNETVQHQEQQKQLAREQALLEENRKLRSKIADFRRITHDFRTPITSIIGYLGIALHNLGNTERVAYIIPKVIEYAYSLNTRITDELIPFQELLAVEQDEKPEVLEAADFLNGVLAQNKEALGIHNIEMRVNQTDKHIKINVFPKKLTAALNNLFGNAIKAMLNGGILEVSTELTEEGYITTIKDTGIGIPKASQRKLFTPKTNEEQSARESSGIGLFTAREIIESCGGALWLENSEVGKGTTFKYMLPVQEIEQSAISSAQVS